jgi:hypothetical protein
VSAGEGGQAPDLWVVAHPGDRVADAVGARAGSRGLSVSRVSFGRFARWVTVALTGSRATVTPSAPVLLRTTWESSGDDPDARFLRLEAHAQAWAACALTAATVINRPSEFGLTGSSDHLTPLSLLRARARDPACQVQISPEIYSSDWLEPDGDWTAQDLISFDTAAVPRRPEGDGPYRFRRWRPARRYATVTVVDACGWAVDHAGSAHDSSLVEPTVAIVRALGLRFGAITWALPGSAAPAVARIDPHPASWRMGPHLDTIAEALLEALVS